MRRQLALVLALALGGASCTGNDSSPPPPPPRPSAAPGDIITVLERPPVPEAYRDVANPYIAVAVDDDGTMYVFGEQPGEITVHPPRARSRRLAELAVSTPSPGVVLDRRTASLYVPGGNDHVVYRVSQNGEVTVVAGIENAPGFSGDGGPARRARLKNPRAVAFDSRRGDLYIADTFNFRIRRVDRNGAITTVAGTGGEVHAGDGGPAIRAVLAAPDGIAFDEGAGALYFCDKGTRIRRIGPDGLISTIAGTGARGSSGDGGPATMAQIGCGSNVAFDPRTGSLYFSEAFNERARRIDAGGTITTVAGTGEKGFSGDGGPATQATLDLPTSVAVDGQGNLYILVHGTPPRIRMVGAPIP